jgi:hypothetical protein
MKFAADKSAKRVACGYLLYSLQVVGPLNFTSRSAEPFSSSRHG